MVSYSKAAVELAMKVQEVILRAMAKKITWWQAAEIVGISDRSMRRWRERYEKFGYDGLLESEASEPSPKRAPVTAARIRKAFHVYISHPVRIRQSLKCVRGLVPLSRSRSSLSCVILRSSIVHGMRGCCPSG